MSDKSHMGILIRVGILWAALQVTVCKIRARWLTGLMERLGEGCISYDIDIRTHELYKFLQNFDGWIFI